MGEPNYLGSNGSPHSGDSDNKLLQKIAGSTHQLANTGVSINAGDVEMGKVEIKDGTSDTTAVVTTTAPAANDPALAVRIVGQTGGTVSVKDNVSGALASVIAIAPTTESGLVVRNIPSGTQTVGGSVSVSNTSGASAVNIQDGGNSITVDGGVTVSQSTASSLKNQVEGTEAHDAPATVNPVRTGLRAYTSATFPADVSADGDVVNAIGDWKGRQFIIPADLIHTSDTVGIMRKATDVDAGYLFGRNTAITNSAVAIKASAGNIYALTITNNNATDAAWVCLYDTASASVTVGTTALSMSKIPVAANSTVILEFEYIRYHSTAISIAATKLVADNDTTAPSTALIIAWRYK